MRTFLPFEGEDLIAANEATERDFGIWAVEEIAIVDELDGETVTDDTITDTIEKPVTEEPVIEKKTATKKR